MSTWTIRAATVADHAPILSVLDEWWGGREMRGLLQPLFLENFSSTSLVAETEDVRRSSGLHHATEARG